MQRGYDNSKKYVDLLNHLDPTEAKPQPTNGEECCWFSRSTEVSME